MFEPHGLKRLPDIVTGDETWFAFFIIPPKRLNRMWVDGQGDRPVVLRPGFQSQKRMFTVFFNYSGPIVVDILPQDTTITATYYVQNVLSQVIKHVTVSTNIVYNFAQTSMGIELENKQTLEQAVGFDITLLKEEFITDMEIQVDGRMLNAAFKNRSTDEMRSQDAIDVSNSAVHLDLAHGGKFGTLYQIDVVVPAEKIVKFNVKSLRLLRKEQKSYMYEVYLSFEHDVISFSAQSILSLRKDMVINTIKPNKDQGINDITIKGRKVEEGDNHVVTWNLTNSDIRKDEKLRWAVGYSRPIIRGLGFCAIDNKGYFVSFVRSSFARIPQRIVFVLDRSASMYPDRIVQLKSAMTSIIDEMQNGSFKALYNILTYAETVKKPWKTTKSIKNSSGAAKAFINSIKPEGMADIHQALSDALEMLQRSRGAKSLGMIVFLTDSVPSAGVDNTETLVREITAKNIDKYPIFSLAYGHNVDIDFLKSLSSKNFGHVRMIDDTENAAEKIKEAIMETNLANLKRMEVTYEKGHTEDVTKTSQHVMLKDTDFFIAGRYIGKPKRFKYVVKGIMFAKKKFKPLKSNPQRCDQKREMRVLPKTMFMYQRLQELLIGTDQTENYTNQHLQETSINKIQQMSLNYDDIHFVTPYTTIEFTWVGLAGTQPQVVRLQQLDLDLMEPVDLTFLKPYYPIEYSKFFKPKPPTNETSPNTPKPKPPTNETSTNAQKPKPPKTKTSLNTPKPKPPKTKTSPNTPKPKPPKTKASLNAPKPRPTANKISTIAPTAKLLTTEKPPVASKSKPPSTAKPKKSSKAKAHTANKGSRNSNRKPHKGRKQMHTELDVFVMRYPTSSSRFKKGKGFCFVARNWNSGVYNIFKDQSGTQILFTNCKHPCNENISKLLRINYKANTTSIKLDGNSKWKENLKQSVGSIGISAQIKGKNKVAFTISKRLKLAIWGDKKRSKKMLYTLEITVLPYRGFHKTRLAGVLGYLAKHPRRLTNAKKTVRRCNRFKNMSFLFRLPKRKVSKHKVRQTKG
ncbi:inter-alpha-trypsin inhibitor heavy chain H3 [Elysia marginata]|uniref:Inter-alpha-trypsin inhibitor heavy chain H3 n=1 Tax=Elysia marginata TaxID=1093978 RepID=A0AAV4GYF0_9GAST|nr:inter-alpha-trypsin inhibitor heavy chain H3 [Elysia marginata]